MDVSVFEFYDNRVFVCPYVCNVYNIYDVGHTRSFGVFIVAHAFPFK